MRQAGILAAGGRWGLSTISTGRDHVRARSVAEAVAKAAPDAVDPDRVEWYPGVGAAGGRPPPSSQPPVSAALRM